MQTTCHAITDNKDPSKIWNNAIRQADPTRWTQQERLQSAQPMHNSDVQQVPHSYWHSKHQLTHIRTQTYMIEYTIHTMISK